MRQSSIKPTWTVNAGRSARLVVLPRSVPGCRFRRGRSRPWPRGRGREAGTAAAWLFAVVAVTGAISALLLVPVGSVEPGAGLALAARLEIAALAAVLAATGLSRLA